MDRPSTRAPRAVDAIPNPLAPRFLFRRYPTLPPEGRSNDDLAVFAAFLTTIFFSLSSIFALRSVRELGSTRANLGRLFFAAFVLGAYAHFAGNGLADKGLMMFLLSGVIGMGLGDLALFAALPRLGSRLSVLLTQCLAAPIAFGAEWFWLGTRLSWAQIACGVVILLGVTVALLPAEKAAPAARVSRLGLLFGVLSALGQGLGAVLSRKANLLASTAGEPVDGISAAYQRILGGLVVTLAFFAAKALLFPPPRGHPSTSRPPNPSRRAWLWVPANALCGAVLGVSCYQWALATTPSGIVLPIVACTPLVIIPFSYFLEGERPSRRSLAGAVLAVAGAAALAVSR